MGLTTLKMPQLGESVTEGTVERWLKAEGEMVRRDEPIVEVVTDKVNAEIPSPFEGRLVRIQVAEGQTVAVGTALAELEIEGAATTPPEPAMGGGVSGISPMMHAKECMGIPAISARACSASTTAYRRVRQGAIFACLVVSRYQMITATADAGAAAGPARSGAREELVRVSAVRRQIADHMVRSVSTSPHAWSLREVDVTRLVEYRDAHREDFQATHGFPLSYVPFFIQIVCDALLDNPYLNSSWTDEGIVLKHYVNMGMAVALPDTLIVPVIRDADQKGFDDLAHAVNDLATRARNRSLRPDDVRGGTFTLNNTGALGSVAGQSIINQPQAAILSTEAIKKRPVVVDDTVVIRPMMNLTMSFDHRIIDGLAASRFLNQVQRGIEEWSPASIRL